VYFWFLIKKYVKNFFLTFFGLSFLYVIVDFMFNFKDLPDSSNLQIMYVFYTFLYASFLLFPLSLVFALLVTISSMIKFNEFVSFYSLGFKPRKLLFPFLAFAMLVTVFMFALQSTKLAYSHQYAKSIRENLKYKTYDLFLKYKNNIIYIKEINPLTKTAWGIKIFKMNDLNLILTLSARKAVYKNKAWHAKNVEITFLNNNVWKKVKLPEKVLLKNFTPKILSNLKSLDSISFYDAYIAIKYFKDINLNMILSIVFFKIFTPLTMIALMMLIFYLTPIHSRISNVSIFMIKSATAAIVLWGIELLLFKFAKQNVVPYWSMTLPFIAVLIADIIIIRRNND